MKSEQTVRCKTVLQLFIFQLYIPLISVHCVTETFWMPLNETDKKTASSDTATTDRPAVAAVDVTVTIMKKKKKKSRTVPVLN
jgi:hypothetical protein